MPHYIWKGRNLAGQAQSGVVTLDSREEVMSFLRKNRVIVTSVREKPKDIRLSMPFKQGVGSRDLAIFTRQFATMIDSGLPLRGSCPTSSGVRQPLCSHGERR
jgi:type IV pilus assembly protein PilC